MVADGTIPKSAAKVQKKIHICKYICIFLHFFCIFLHPLIRPGTSQDLPQTSPSPSQNLARPSQSLAIPAPVLAMPAQPCGVLTPAARPPPSACRKYHYATKNDRKVKKNEKKREKICICQKYVVSSHRNLTKYH